MKLKKTLSIFLLLLFVLSAFTPFVLADNPPTVTAKWLKNEGDSISDVLAGEQLELYLIANSEVAPSVSINILGSNNFNQNVVSGVGLLKVPGNNNYYDYKFIIDTAGLNGDYSVQVSVLNAFGVKHKSLALNVLGNEVPQNNKPGFEFTPTWDYTESGNFISIPVWEREVGSNFEVKILGTDSDGDSLEITSQPVPNLAYSETVGVKLVDNGDNTATVSGTPTTTGEYSLLFTVDDGQDFVQYVMKFNFIPEPVVDELKIKQLIQQDGEETKPLSFTIEATGASNQVFYQIKETTGCTSNEVWCLVTEFYKNQFGDPTPENAQFDALTGKYTFTPSYEYVQHPNLEKTLKLKYRAVDGEKYSEWRIVDLVIDDKNRPPKLADITGPSELQVNEAGIFSSTATDLDGDTVTLSWDFADGTVAAGESVTHEYQTAGTFVIKLTAADNFGGEDEVTHNVEVTEKEDILGCMDVDALNYNPVATKDDGSCVVKVLGCTDKDALNYNPDANVDDGSCVAKVLGCTNKDALNYNPDANVDDGSCELKVLGCMDPAATNHDPNANVDDGSCKYGPVDIPGCMDKEALNYNSNANLDDGSCQYLPVFGCMDESAINYNPDATKDDGSCKYSPVEVPGCMDSIAVNYNNQATIDDGSCEYVVKYLKIVSVPGTIASVGKQYSYQVLVEPSVANGKINYELLSAPQGMTINNNGLVQYMPTKEGLFQVTVKVSRSGLEAFQTYVLQVKDLESKGSLRISSVYVNPEQAHAGDYAAIYVDMKNNGHKDLEDVQITAVIYDLGQQVQSDKINLDKGDQVGEVLYVHVPYYTQPGEYLVTVSVKNDEFTEESYRFFNVI